MGLVKKQKEFTELIAKPLTITQDNDYRMIFVSDYFRINDVDYTNQQFEIYYTGGLTPETKEIAVDHLFDVLNSMSLVPKELRYKIPDNKATQFHFIYSLDLTQLGTIPISEHFGFYAVFDLTTYDDFSQLRYHRLALTESGATEFPVFFENKYLKKIVLV